MNWAPLRIGRARYRDQDHALEELFESAVISAVGDPHFTLSTYLSEHQNQPQEALTAFQNAISDALHAEGNVHIVATGINYPNANVSHGMHLKGDGPSEHCINNIRLVHDWGMTRFIFEGIRVHKVNLGSRVSAIFRNCEIGRIELTESDADTMLLLQNSAVRSISLRARCCSSLSVEGGTILKIWCVPPASANPFTGTVDFSNVRFSTDPWIMSDVQEYRNLRHHLMELQNLESAGTVQRIVLIEERRQAKSRIYKASSYFYELFSDFGNSPTRPVVAWAVGAFVSFLFIYYTNGALLSVEPSSAFVGWREHLQASDEKGMAWRSLILTLEAWAGPLGILYDHNLVQSRTWGVGLLTIFARLFSTVLLTLFILALRRRFRMT